MPTYCRPNRGPSFSLTIYNAAAPRYGLEVGLMWFVPGILLAAGYFFYTYRSLSSKIRL
jgi:cytochrome bd-type quinol oxidase subunit 2